MSFSSTSFKCSLPFTLLGIALCWPILQICAGVRDWCDLCMFGSFSIADVRIRPLLCATMCEVSDVFFDLGFTSHIQISVIFIGSWFFVIFVSMFFLIHFECLGVLHIRFGICCINLLTKCYSKRFIR